jgi:hypothetical protein
MCACRPPSILSAARHHQRRRFGAVKCAVNRIAPEKTPRRTPGYTAWVTVWPNLTGDAYISGGGKGIAESPVVWMDGRTKCVVHPCVHLRWRVLSRNRSGMGKSLKNPH